MSAHKLALEVIETSCENILRITDMSVYATGLAVDCPRLDIWLPGAAQPVYLDSTTTPVLTSSFDLRLTPVILYPNITTTTSTVLPDGIYTIRYSVSPNDIVYVEYYHLRVTQLLNDYFRELCKIQLAECEPSSEMHQKLHDLRYIRLLIDAAKVKAEICHSPKQARDMYAYAQKQLAKYKTGGCVTCNH